MKALKNKNKYFKAATLVVLTGFFAYFSLSVENFSVLLRTSLIGFPEHDPFDGTVYPIKKVPNWVSASGEKWKQNFSEFSENELIDIPFYDPEILKVGTDTLVWGNKDHNTIRNAKITYPVPYLGNYKLDGLEYAGSHPAVDIKVPEGTPVYSIANGTIVKVSTTNSGFGFHIVIRHNNFPTLSDPER